MSRLTRRTEMIGLTAHFVDELPHGQQRRPIIAVGKMFSCDPCLDLGGDQPGVHPTALRRTARGLQNQAGADSVVPHV